MAIAQGGPGALLIELCAKTMLRPTGCESSRQGPPLVRDGGPYGNSAEPFLRFTYYQQILSSLVRGPLYCLPPTACYSHSIVAGGFELMS